jgi:hypothetical protein
MKTPEEDNEPGLAGRKYSPKRPERQGLFGSTVEGIQWRAEMPHLTADAEHVEGVETFAPA